MTDSIERASAIKALQYVLDSPNYSKALSYMLRIPTVDTSQTERSACDTCYVYNSGIPCGVEPSVCKQEVADTPQTEIKTGCSRCEAKRRCQDANSEVARWCNNYNKDTQTDCAWK